MFDLVKFIQKEDLAKPSFLQILLFYPGVHAVGLHRIAHFFWRKGFKTLGIMFSSISRFFTGIDIHPGAIIGERVFIDHGYGTVIGETAIIGDNCLLHQNVTLGNRGAAIEKRHPTLDKNVMVGAGATVLGPITVGAHAQIGANAVVTSDVPEGCTVVGNPGRTIKRDGKENKNGLPAFVLSDPVGETIDKILDDIKLIKKELKMDQCDDMDKDDPDYIDRWKGSGI